MHLNVAGSQVEMFLLSNFPFSFFWNSGKCSDSQSLHHSVHSFVEFLQPVQHLTNPSELSDSWLIWAGLNVCSALWFSVLKSVCLLKLFEVLKMRRLCETHWEISIRWLKTLQRMTQPREMLQLSRVQSLCELQYLNWSCRTKSTSK